MEKIEEKLFDYLEGTLSVEERERVEKAIRRDGALEKEMERLREADALMVQHNMPGFPDEGFTDRVMGRVQMKGARAKSGNKLIRMALGIFGGMFVAVLALLQGFSETSPAPEVQNNYLPKLPAVDITSLLETVDNPALLQLAMIVSAMAVLLVVDKVLSKKFRINLPSFI